MTAISSDRILDNLSSSIICLDQNLVISQVNATAEVFFDTSSKILLGKPLSGLFDINIHSSILASLKYCLTNNHQITEHQATLNLADRRSVTTDYSIHPIQETSNTKLLIEIKPIDRHIEINKESQRIAQKKATQQLVRGMAHEIKNPLGGIRGAAQLLESEITNPALSEYTDVIIREADRLQTLMNSMLGPNKAIHKQNINILEILEHLRSVILAEFSDDLIIQRDYDPSIPDLSADKGQLIQALLNIARNAAQSAVSNTKAVQNQVTFKTRISRQHTIDSKRYKHVLQIDIIDNGPGIAKDLQENIFLPMVTNKAEGSGLGLPIAQQIIFSHDGIIQCQSDEQQTQFTILIPLTNDT